MTKNQLLLPLSVNLPIDELYWQLRDLYFYLADNWLALAAAVLIILALLALLTLGKRDRPGK
jgi:hypothetical protein